LPVPGARACLTMDERTLKKHLERKRKLLQRLKPFIKPGSIVEFGCGSGFVLEFLSREFPHSRIIGIDNDLERVASVAEKNLPNVIPICAAIEENIFPAAVFDTAVFVCCLHEIFSQAGGEGVMKALRIACDVLKPGGAVIIQDYLKPESISVEVRFADELLLERFIRFAGEFKPRRVDYELHGDIVRVDAADAFEFVSKYHAEDEEHWQEEMHETHFFFTKSEFEVALGEVGFDVTSIEEPPGSGILTESHKGFSIKPSLKVGWIQVVGRKGLSKVNEESRP